MSSANSCVGWLANDWHGTSLRNCTPKELHQETLEVGMAFQLSPTLATKWAQYCAANFSEEVRQRVLATLGKED